ncbi:MAG TPA: response regulator transcription factor [Vicinamibacterales bacterium]|jgi:DNA-binding response OmpR family regulator|nr:response regulator transcription factor [Vicinamibacterales bacterium]
MPGRILIVEDDNMLAKVIGDNLRFAGYEISAAAEGHEAVARLRTFQPDLVLLDLMLPDRSGFDLCGVLRQGGRTPVVILSARAQKADKLRGLKLGADDYLTKPFDLDELLARIQAVLRRSRRGVDRLVLGAVTIDFNALRAVTGKREVHLTHREFGVLRYLAERHERVVYRDELLREIWGYLDVPPTTRSVDHAIARLRKKIEPDPHRPRFIRTVHGDGYVLNTTAHDARES